jgi:uncharacterized protein YhbP (UPF0306 family)
VSTQQPVAEVPQHVLDFLEQQSTMTLATASPGGVPHASTFLYVNEGATLYFWGKPGTTTARHVEQNPSVAFTVDQYAGDLSQTKGVQGTGECSVILSGETIARVADLFGQKFPDLAPGATMSISFYRVVPTELNFIDNSASGAGRREGEFGAEFHRERSFSIFAELPAAPLSEAIMAAMQAQSADAGELVVRQGGPADKFFVVTEGELEVVRETAGSESVVATLGPGHFFGEISIVRDQPREASLRATKPTQLLAMERDQFRDVVAEALGTTADFEQVLAGRLQSPSG